MAGKNKHSVENTTALSEPLQDRNYLVWATEESESCAKTHFNTKNVQEEASTVSSECHDLIGKKLWMSAESLVLKLCSHKGSGLRTSFQTGDSCRKCSVEKAEYQTLEIMNFLLYILSVYSKISQVCETGRREERENLFG